VPIFLIRHGHAGSRSQWGGDDDRRPLSAKGRRQAEHLASLVVDQPVGRLLASPSRRCAETLGPLCARTGLVVEPVAELAEGTGGETAERFLLAIADQNPVACTHGDVIPRVLQRLHAAGMRVQTDTVAAKGSLWVLRVDAKGAVTHGTYHSPID
jgi:broad specificity phosphatase PhoE